MDKKTRQSWGGLKRHIKNVVSLPGVSQLTHAAVSRTLPNRGSHRVPTPMSITESDCVVDGVTFKMRNPSRCVVAKELYWGRGRRARPADNLALEVWVRRSRSNAFALDIGAYTGLFSLAAGASSPTIKVHAYEIVPANFLALYENLFVNDLADGRVEPHLLCVGSTNGVVRMATGEGGSALPDFWNANLGGEADGVAIPVLTLDSIYKQEDLSPGVIVKIDTEGSEYEVLSGAHEFLNNVQPDIICEILPTQEFVEDIDTLLDLHEYHRYLITDEGIVSSRKVSGNERYRDWFFTKAKQRTLSDRLVGINVS